LYVAFPRAMAVQDEAYCRGLQGSLSRGGLSEYWPVAAALAERYGAQCVEDLLAVWDIFVAALCPKPLHHERFEKMRVDIQARGSPREILGKMSAEIEDAYRNLMGDGFSDNASEGDEFQGGDGCLSLLVNDWEQERAALQAMIKQSSHPAASPQRPPAPQTAARVPAPQESEAFRSIRTKLVCEVVYSRLVARAWCREACFEAWRRTAKQTCFANVTTHLARSLHAKANNSARQPHLSAVRKMVGKDFRRNALIRAFARWREHCVAASYQDEILSLRAKLRDASDGVTNPELLKMKQDLEAEKKKLEACIDLVDRQAGQLKRKGMALRGKVRRSIGKFLMRAQQAFVGDAFLQWVAETRHNARPQSSTGGATAHRQVAASMSYTEIPASKQHFVEQTKGDLGRPELSDRRPSDGGRQPGGQPRQGQGGARDCEEWAARGAGFFAARRPAKRPAWVH